MTVEDAAGFVLLTINVNPMVSPSGVSVLNDLQTR